MIPPVKKTITVGLSVEKAFHRFTTEINQWWPIADHSIGQEKTVGIVFDGRVGGTLHETQRDGARVVWGTITSWTPPDGVALTWHPGRNPDTAQTVEISFAAVDGGTRVDLVHTGWERLGEEAQASRDDYDGGWVGVFERFRQSCE